MKNNIPLMILNYFLKDDSKINWSKEEKKQGLKDYKYILQSKKDTEKLIQDIQYIINCTCDPDMKKEGKILIHTIKEGGKN